MKTTRKPPRRPKSITYSKANNSALDLNADDLEEPPPDPHILSTRQNCRCLLQDLDPHKVILLLNGHPAARGTALLLQALRQQMSVATSDEYVQGALDWVIANDILTLKMKKNSVIRRVMQADGVDSREQMARLLNTMASYPKGREYFCVHLKTFLPCIVAIVRGKRLPSTTHDQLIACIQKMSVRQTAQKEMLQCGVLEWAVTHLEQKLTAYALEYLCALVVNLCTNYLSQPLVLRFADSIAASTCSLLNRGTHGASCSIYNAFVLTALGCSRVRFRARDTRLYDALKQRLEGPRRVCPLCNLHVPFLIALISSEAEAARIPQPPCDPSEANTAISGISCEREVDSLDPLRPSTNELSGARLLIRRALKDSHGQNDEQMPGQVPYKMGGRGATSSSKRGKSEPRIGTATSQHTFVIETERRRPLMINAGLSEGAIEYKRLSDAAAKQRDDEERKKAEAAEKEKVRHKTLRNGSLTSRKAPSILKKGYLGSSLPLDEKHKKLTSVAYKSPFQKSSVTNLSPVTTPSSVEDKHNLAGASPVGEHPPREVPENAKLEDYTAVFSSRPKIARTPDTQSRSFF